MRHQLTFLIVLIIFSLFLSCGSNENRVADSESAYQDSTEISQEPSGYEYPEEVAEPVPISKPQKSNVKKSNKPHYSGKTESVTSSGNWVMQAAPESVTAIRQPIRKDKVAGSIVYYCPARMMENSDNNVSVTITKTDLKDAIIQIEKRVEATTGKPAELIKKDVNGTTISISAKMKVELKYSDKDFETIYKPENDDRIFDGTNDMNWDWIIKPMNIGTKQLSIVVSAFDALNGRWIAVQSPPKIFDIKVQVDPRSYFARMWKFLQANPEWLFTQMLFPVIAFFFGKKQGRKSSSTE